MKLGLPSFFLKSIEKKSEINDKNQNNKNNKNKKNNGRTTIITTGSNEKLKV